jgi:hypothetical protein
LDLSSRLFRHPMVTHYIHAAMPLRFAIFCGMRVRAASLYREGLPPRRWFPSARVPPAKAVPPCERLPPHHDKPAVDQDNTREAIGAGQCSQRPNNFTFLIFPEHMPPSRDQRRSRQTAHHVGNHRRVATASEHATSCAFMSSSERIMLRASGSGTAATPDDRSRPVRLNPLTPTMLRVVQEFTQMSSPELYIYGPDRQAPGLLVYS